MIRHLLNILLWMLPPTRLFSLRRTCLRIMRLDVSADASVCGGGWIYGPGAIHIGQGAWISPGTLMYTHVNAPIRIEARCDIGPFVRILTGGHEIGPTERRAGLGTAQPVTIGMGCWIGASTTILGGATIGAGTIVAAGSIVTGDLPPGVLAAGVPAKVKRTLP